MPSIETVAFRPGVPGLPRTRLAVGALALPAILLVALAIRIAAVWTQTYVLFVDETFQYFEQGHRLAFGSGLVPWEFQDGIRSWLLPGLIAGLMRLSSLISDDPLVYVRLTRCLCVALSLVVVLAGFRAGQRRNGLAGAIVTGGFCAIWFDLIYFAPAVLTEVLAAHCTILAIWLGEREAPSSSRRLLLTGGLFGLAFCLRYQYAPAMLAAVLWRYRLAWPSWRWLLTGALMVVIPAAGALDALTWGWPFQSIWLNFLRNSVQGVSAGMGAESGFYYLAYLDVSLRPLPLLGALAVLGAVRMPALGLAAAVTLLEHSLVPHKEVRFIYLVLAAAPILIGLGFSDLARRLRTYPRASPRLFELAPTAHAVYPESFGSRVSQATLAAAFLIVTAGLSWWTGAVTLGPRWQFERANTLAFLAANREPALCGLAVRDVWFWETGGYTYLNRDVPLYFSAIDPGQTLAGSDRTLSLIEIRHGKPMPRITGERLGAATSRFSHMIAKRGDGEPGYEPVACFDDVARHGEPELCLFRRPGGCS